MSPLLGSIGGISEYNYRGTLDDWPNPFAFGDLINVTPGTVPGISTVITGINYKASVSASGNAQISVRNVIGISSIYSGNSNTPSNVVTVSIAKSTTELTVGSNIRITNTSDSAYNGEFVVDSILDSPYVTKFTYIIPEIPSTARPGIATANFSYQVYPFVSSELVYIRNNQILEVRIPTTINNDTDFDKQYRTTVRVGKRYASWSVRTREKDNSPNPFFFQSVTGSSIGIATTSNSIVISGLEPGFSSYAYISSGIGSFSVNGSPGLSTANVTNGDVIHINQFSSDYYSSNTVSSLTVGTYTTTFTVITRPADRIPDQFYFNSLINVPINQDQVSISTSLTGADNNIPLTSLLSFPGELKINDNNYVSGATEVFNGDIISLRIPAKALSEYGTTYSTQLTISGITSSFFVSTRPRPIKTFPDQFRFTDLSGVSPSSYVESSLITLSGMTVGVADTGLATISNGSEFRVIRNGSIIKEYSSSPFAVKNSDQIQLRILSAGEGSSFQTIFTVSGVDTTNDINGISGFTADTWDVSSRFLNCKINETTFKASLISAVNAKIRELKSVSFTVSGLDNGCDTIITTSNPDSYIRNQNGIQVASSQQLDIKNGDVITIYMTASSAYDTIKTTTIETKRKNGTDSITGIWSIRTQLEDKRPDPFNLPTRNQNNVSPCTFRTTYVTENLSGLSEETIVSAAVTSTNGTAEISKNGGQFESSIVGGVKNGDRIDIRMKSNCNYGGNCEIATVVVGETTESWTLCPEPIPFPTINLQSNTTSVDYNGSVTLNWTSTFATSVTSSSGTGFVGIGSTTGTITINNLKASSTYSITVANSRGSATSSININVTNEPSPRVTLTANPSSVFANTSTVLTWNSTNAASVVATEGTGFVNISSVNGSTTVTPSFTTVIKNYKGLTARKYSGYFGSQTQPSLDNVNYTTNLIPIEGPIYQEEFNKAFAGEGSGYNNTTWMIEGYFLPPTSGIYTFFTNSDDASYLWIGDNALIGYTIQNALVKNGGIHSLKEVSASISLNGGIYYPIRVMYGNQNNLVSNPTELTISFSGPGIAKRTNGIGYYFSKDVPITNNNETYSITVRNESGVTAKASTNIALSKPLCTNGPGVYLDLTQFASTTIPVTLSVVANSSTIFHQVEIPGFGIIKENDPPKTFQVLGGTSYGPCVTPSRVPVCISIIDEVTPTELTIKNDWLSFRLKYSNSVFWLLAPGGATPTALKVPSEYLSDTKAYGPINVSRDNGNISLRSDWFETCNLSSYPAETVISLAIDNSGSMTSSTVSQSLSLFRQKCSQAGLELIEVQFSDERWAPPHNKNFPYSYVSTLYVGNEIVSGINGSGTRPITQLVVEEGGDDWNDMVISTNSGFFRRCVGTTTPIPSPTVSLSTPNLISGNTITINPYDNITLNWISTNASSVKSYSGYGFIPKSISGSISINCVNENTSYNITVSGPSGIATSNTINVLLNKPTITLIANPTTVSHNGSTTLTWTSTNASSVQSSNFGASSVSGSLVVSNLTSTTSSSVVKRYSISVVGPGGSETGFVDVTILPPGPSGSLVASPPSISYNGSSTLSWNTANATSIESNFGISSTALNGSLTLNNLTSTKTYTITAYGYGGKTTSISTNINVGAAPPTVQLCAVRISSEYGPLFTECGSSKSVAFKETFRLDWTSTNASSVKAYSGSGFVPTTTSGSITIQNISQATTFSITVIGSGGESTDAILITPASCAAGIFEDTFAVYKLGTFNYKNSTSVSPPPYSNKLPLKLLVSTKTTAPLPGRSNYTYDLMYGFIYRAYRSIINRSPEKEGIEYYMNRFITEPSSFRTLNELYKVIDDNAAAELSDRSSRGGLLSITDSCSNNWEASLPTPSNFICTTSLITDTTSNAYYKKGFVVYANGKNGPIDQFFVSTINPNLSLPNRPDFTYGKVYAYIYSVFSNSVSDGGLGRPPEKDGLVYWVNAFQNKNNDGTYFYKTLSDLGSAIQSGRTQELNDRDANDGFVSVVDECGEVWDLKGNGVYLDLTGFSSSNMVMVTLSITANESTIYHSVNIVGLGRIFEDSSPRKYALKGGRIYGPCSAPRGKIYIGNESIGGIVGSGSKLNTDLIVEEGGDDWNDMVIRTSAGIWKRFTAPTIL